MAGGFPESEVAIAELPDPGDDFAVQVTGRRAVERHRHIDRAVYRIAGVGVRWQAARADGHRRRFIRVAQTAVIDDRKHARRKCVLYRL